MTLTTSSFTPFISSATVRPPGKRLSRGGLFGKLLALLGFLILPATADQFGDFTYSDNGTTITIDGYTGVGGAVSIPASIVGKPVTALGDYAFSSAPLTSVTIPSGVIHIGEYAFGYCGELTNVTIPSSVSSFGRGPFGACAALTGIAVDPGNPNFSSSGGVLFDELNTALVQFPCGLGGAYAIPASVTRIEEWAFDGCGLTSVTVPSSVTTVGAGPFYRCSELVAIDVDSSNPNYSSNGGVMFDKLQTALIQFPGGVGGSYTIPSSVTNIQHNAFEGSFLSGVTIPSSVTSIGERAFSFCTNLTSVIIPSNVKNFGNGVFSFCSALTTVILPPNLTRIGESMLSFCSGLTGVTIPSSVTSIGIDAFFGCNSLTSLTIPSDVTDIGDYAFRSCESLTSATFLGSAPSMGGEVFDYAAEGFTIYYSGSTSGFSSPTWLGYPAVDLFVPEITVELPSSPALVDGSSMIVFQSISAGSAVTKTFTIRNDGQQPLTGLALSKEGPAAGNFILGPLGATFLPVGASITFDVTCTPQAGSPQIATLHIASDDADEDPFDIGLSARVVSINSDDFNDNSRDTAKWGTDITSGTGGLLAETSARLQYTSTTASGDHGSYRPWILSQATYDKDWEMVMDVTNSISFLPGPLFRDTGIGIEIFPPATFDQSFFTEMNSSGWETDSFHGFVSGQGENETGASDQEISSPGVVGSIRVVFNSATKVITTYCDADGSANGYAWTPLGTLEITGAVGVPSANWNMTGSQVFQIAVYGFVDGSVVTSGQLYADNFSITTQASGPPPSSPVQSWQIAKFGSTSAPEAALDFDADKDSLPNLLEYAFKLEPQVPGTPVLTTLTGTSGLPRITPTGTGPTQRLRLEYVRKKASSNPGITYLPQFSSSLQGGGIGGWSAITGPETVESIDTEWERVVVEDTAGTGLPGRFGRVIVNAP